MGLGIFRSLNAYLEEGDDSMYEVRRRTLKRINIGVLGDIAVKEVLEWFERNDPQQEGGDASSKTSEKKEEPREEIDPPLPTLDNFDSRDGHSSKLVKATKKMKIWPKGALVTLHQYYSGVDENDTITADFYRRMHGFVLVFDVADFDSFQNMRMHIQNIDLYSQKGTDVSMVLLGVQRSVKEEREIQKESAEGLQKDRGILKYFDIDHEDPNGTIADAVTLVAKDCKKKNRFIEPHDNEDESACC
eukprot:g4417.t1